MNKDTLHYPPTKKIQQFDDYHGTTVADPYRWLEDTDATETREWIAAQNNLTQFFLKDVPEKEYILQRLKDLWNFQRSYAHRRYSERYFQLRNDGLQNQDILYWMDSPSGRKRVLIDPNKFSDGGSIALTDWEISRNGELIAYAISEGGTDWKTWRVREVVTGEDRSDLIEWSKFTSVAWLPDNSGFYYSRYAEPNQDMVLQTINKNQKVYFHSLGTPQSEDRLVYQRLDQPEWGFAASLSEDGKYLLLKVSQGTDKRNRFFYQDLHSNQ